LLLDRLETALQQIEAGLAAQRAAAEAREQRLTLLAAAASDAAAALDALIGDA
jgi:hypothetical protein